MEAVPTGLLESEYPYTHRKEKQVVLEDIKLTVPGCGIRLDDEEITYNSQSVLENI